MPSPNKTRKLTTLAMLAASALVLSWLDSLIPVSGVLPGAKLGLANLSVLMGLYLLGPGAGGVLCLLKVLLSTFLFGNAFSFFYALAGSVLSYAVMLILKKYCSVVFVSVMGRDVPQSGPAAGGGSGAGNRGTGGLSPGAALCWTGCRLCHRRGRQAF